MHAERRRASPRGAGDGGVLGNESTNAQRDRQDLHHSVIQPAVGDPDAIPFDEWYRHVVSPTRACPRVRRWPRAARHRRSAAAPLPSTTTSRSSITLSFNIAVAARLLAPVFFLRGCHSQLRRVEVRRVELRHLQLSATVGAPHQFVEDRRRLEGDRRSALRALCRVHDRIVASTVSVRLPTSVPRSCNKVWTAG